MLIGLVAAIVSAIAYGIASVLQALSARDQADSGKVDPRLLARLATQGPFVAGTFLDMIGFAAQFFALHYLAVFVVQAVQAGNLAVTAIVAIPVLGARLAGREWAAIAAVSTGLILLALAAGQERAEPVGGPVLWGLLVGSVVVLVAGLLVGRMKGPRAAPALGFVTGLEFGVVALAARVIHDYSIVGLLTNPAAYALVIGGVTSFLFLATGLQRGKVTVVISAIIVGETLLPALIGIVLLGDRPRPGYAPLAIIGFALAVTGSLLLARFGEPEKAVSASPAQ